MDNSIELTGKERDDFEQATQEMDVVDSMAVNDDHAEDLVKPHILTKVLDKRVMPVCLLAVILLYGVTSYVAVVKDLTQIG